MFFNVFDRLLERCDKCIRLSQRLLCKLELRDQHTGLIDHDQPITLFHNDALFGCDPTRIQRTGILLNKGPLNETEWTQSSGKGGTDCLRRENSIMSDTRCGSRSYSCSTETHVLSFKGGYGLFFRIAQLNVISIHAGQKMKAAGLKGFFDHSLRGGNLHPPLNSIELLARENEHP